MSSTSANRFFGKLPLHQYRGRSKDGLMATLEQYSSDKTSQARVYSAGLCARKCAIWSALRPPRRMWLARFWPQDTRGVCHHA